MYLGRWHQGRFRRGSRNDLNYSSASSKPYPRRIQTSPRPSHARSRSRKGLPKIAGERATRGGIDRSSLGAPVSPSPIDPLLQSFASSAGGRSSRFFFFFFYLSRGVCVRVRDDGPPRFFLFFSYVDFALAGYYTSDVQHDALLLAEGLCGDPAIWTFAR